MTSRLQDSLVASKSVTLRVSVHDGFVDFLIVDQGPGFDWNRYLTMDPERAADPNGRGIAMASMASDLTITYMGRGNRVMVRGALREDAA